MEEQNLTSRQLQAAATKNKIYQASIELMEKEGYDNIKIEDICKKAEVSIGSFYNYFKSKNDILVEIFKRADDYFKNEVLHNLKCDNSINEIIMFFVYYAKYDEYVGVDTMKQLYGPNNKMFITKGRYMQEVLKNIILKGQEKGQISTDMTADEINNYLFVAARGIAYDWCIHDGTYDLKKFMEKYLERLVPIFKP
ncbi:TetR/AcrR family transcriptional regulator [Clostridium peptidivorans]|uniref:TetR/AcrR family transcriptional regulator n=1 Tax=Clostridium peptidivorans TaxID=100174 RepID=UPI000BE42541|nr:TetR/AcrR family transcriptional regulator [Clostridium peptidivorans]